MLNVVQKCCHTKKNLGIACDYEVFLVGGSELFFYLFDRQVCSRHSSMTTCSVQAAFGFCFCEPTAVLNAPQNDFLQLRRTTTSCGTPIPLCVAYTMQTMCNRRKGNRGRWKAAPALVTALGLI